MAGIELKNVDRPDETRPFKGNGTADVVVVGGRTIGRVVIDPSGFETYAEEE